MLRACYELAIFQCEKERMAVLGLVVYDTMSVPCACKDSTGGESHQDATVSISFPVSFFSFPIK